MLPYLQWSVAHPQDSQDPTVSPVPSSVNGTVQLLVYNNAGYAITVRLMHLDNPVYLHSCAPCRALLLAHCHAVTECQRCVLESQRGLAKRVLRAPVPEMLSGRVRDGACSTDRAHLRA